MARFAVGALVTFLVARWQLKRSQRLEEIRRWEEEHKEEARRRREETTKEKQLVVDFLVGRRRWLGTR
jgi:hypothetical protein